MRRLLSAYACHRATYRVGVVFPDGRAHWYRFDFGSKPRASTDASGAACLRISSHRIEASALTGWSRHARSFLSVRASRRAGAVPQPIRDGVRLEPRRLSGLLMYYVRRKANGSELAAKYEGDHQLEVLRTEALRGS